MTKVSVGSGLTVKGRRPSSIRVSEDGTFKGSQPEINFTGDVSVTNDPANNKVTVNITGGGGSVTLASLGTTLQTAAADTPDNLDTSWFYDVTDGIIKLWTWATQKSALATYFNSLYWKVTGTTTITSNADVSMDGEGGLIMDFDGSVNGAVRTPILHRGDGTFAGDYAAAYPAKYTSGIYNGKYYFSIDVKNGSVLSFIYLDHLFASIGIGEAKIEISDTGGLVIKDDNGLIGFRYNADYSAANASSPRWIPDKAYVDNLVTGLLELKGSTDCSANPNYPAGVVGDLYYVTVAGKIGGASGKSVDVGDAYVCKADNAGGTEAAVGTSWFVLEHNLTGVLLSANNLSDLTNAATARTNLGAQATLVSGTNIKTVNGNSLLGSGDLIVSGSGASYWTDLPGTPTRSSDTVLTITDTANANLYDLKFNRGTVLKWTDTTVKQAMVVSATYAANTVTITIIGDVLAASATMNTFKYSIEKAEKVTFAIAGTIATGTNLSRKWKADKPYRIFGADGLHGTAGTTNATTYDLNKNGTTFMTTKLSIASAATVGNGYTADDGTLLALDDVVSLDCDSVSTTAPVDVYVDMFIFPTYNQYL